MCVHDRLVLGGGESQKAATLARNIDGLVRGAGRYSGADSVALEQAEFPPCDSSMDGTACVLGMVVSRLCSHVKLRFADLASEDYVKRARAGLRLGFGMLRAGEDQSGERDVLRLLRLRDSCMELLRLLSGSFGSSDGAGAEAAGTGSGPATTSTVKESEFQPLRLLTLNIAGTQTSASGPAWWTEGDKVAAMLLEVARWDPHVIAFQECSGRDRWVD